MVFCFRVCLIFVYEYFEWGEDDMLIKFESYRNLGKIKNSLSDRIGFKGFWLVEIMEYNYLEIFNVVNVSFVIWFLKILI